MNPPTCAAVRAALASYYDAATDRAALDAHLAGCPACRGAFETLQRELRELACRDLVELITEYLDAAPGTPLATRVDRHLRLCQGCRDYVAQMERSIGLLGRLPADADIASATRRLAPAALAAFRGRTRPT